MRTRQKETPASGDNHLAGVKHKNKGLIIARRRLMNSGNIWARAAQLGWAVERSDGGYRLTKVNRSVYCPDLATVAHLLLDDGY